MSSIGVQNHGFQCKRLGEWFDNFICSVSSNDAANILTGK